VRVLVLMGGSSTERDVSLATGRGVSRALSALGHEVVALDPAAGRLALESLEHLKIGETPGAAGMPVVRSERSLVLARDHDLEKTDVVFVALHGGIGEDGTLQAMLDLAGVAYTGSGMLASALAMDKHKAKAVMTARGIAVPPGRLLARREEPLDVSALGGFPVVVKPNTQGSSVAVHIVEEAPGLPAALDDAFRYPPVLVEAFIPGREITVAVLGGRALPVVEIVPETGFYDYRHKYTKGQTRYVCPAELPAPLATAIARAAEEVHDALGCAGVARVDFRLAADGRFYCLELNTIPGMTETSLVPMAAKAAGMSYEDLVGRLVELARERGGRGR
jgi:D-alanine-D-alanine ligase